MTEYMQLITNGILLGSVYGLLGLGMSIIFGIIGLTNLVHGEFVVLGAYASALLAQAFGADPIVSMLITVPAMFCLGFLLQWLLITPAMQRGGEPALLVTFGISVILQDALLLLFTSDARHIDVPYSTDVLHVFGIDISIQNIILSLVSLTVVGVLTLFLNRTFTGRAIRAVSDDVQAAQLSGINVPVIYAIAMGTAMATAAAAGACVGIKWTFYPSSGNQYLLISFIVVVIGGMESIYGTLLGGIIFGLAQVFGGATYGLLISYALLIVILGLRHEDQRS